MTSSFKSILLTAYTTGISPTTLKTLCTQSSSSLSVEYRVRSQTATTPFAPWKNASLRRSRKPFSPMMSQTVMSMSIFVRSRVSNVISRFETFAPSVVMYRSSNSSWTNRRIRDVLPTAASPTRQTFVLMRWASGIGGVVGFALDYLKGPPHPASGRNLFLRRPLEGLDAARPPPGLGARRDRPEARGRDRPIRETTRRRGQGGMAARPRGWPQCPSDARQIRLRPVRLQDRGHPEHKPAHRRASGGRGRIGNHLPWFRRGRLRASVRRCRGREGGLRRGGDEPSGRCGVHGEARGGPRAPRDPSERHRDHRAGDAPGTGEGAAGHHRTETDSGSGGRGPGRKGLRGDRRGRGRRHRRPGHLRSRRSRDGGAIHRGRDPIRRLAVDVRPSGETMKITPLAADSLGARSMATLVETPDVTILLDPSVRLGPYRYDLPPHPTERSRQKELWQVIREASKKANVLTVSHYHFDHHNPAAQSIFRGKLAFLKDGKFHINRSQRERSSAFVRKLKSYPKAIQVADGNQIDFAGTELLFSPAVPHGYNDELGYVVMARIAQGHEVFVHTSDVIGPPLKEQLSFLIDAQPTVLYVDGPMTHMPENYPKEHTKRSLAHLVRILRTTDVRTLVLDHHILRDREWRSRMVPVFEAGTEDDRAGLTAAEFAGKPVDQLEANRDKLYGIEPSPKTISGAGPSEG